MLIDAVPLVLREWPGVKFVLGGRRRLRRRPTCKSLRASGSPDNIIFTGAHIRRGARRLFKVADCAVFPSLYEPFGIVALRRWRRARPWWSASGWACRRWWNARDGHQSQPGDAGSLAWGILYTLQNPEWSRRRAINANREVRALYNWSEIARSTRELSERSAEAKQDDWAYKT